MKNDNYKKTTQTKEAPKNRTGLWNKSKISKRLTNQYQKRGIKDLSPYVDDTSKSLYNYENYEEPIIPYSVLGDYLPIDCKFDDYIVIYNNFT